MDDLTNGRRIDLTTLRTEILALVEYLFEDLLTRKNHQADFDNTRAEYIRQRLSVLLVAVSPVLVLWSLIDYQILSADAFKSIFTTRLLTAASLLIVANWVYRSRDLQICRLALTITLMILNGFYLLSQVVLGGPDTIEANFAYSLFPFLYMSMLTIFPLTASESAFLAALNLITVAIVHYLRGTFFNFELISDLWFLSALFLIVLWAQMAQLHMLMRLYRQATRDPLTGLLNRRKLLESMRAAIAESSKNNSPAVMLLFDLDHFKRVNDNYGHQSGDKVLRAFAKVLEENMRDTDSIGRYGGEEFICMLPCTSTDLGQQIAERIRDACIATHVKSLAGEDITFTTSAGVARYEPHEKLTTFIDRADDSLYHAKHEGRNRVVVTSA